MKGNDKIITALNGLLADELTAINQYMVHSEMCDNWGYEKLHKAIEKRAIDEMHHAEWLIQRIIFLEGLPVVSKLNAIHIGANVFDMVANDSESEVGAIHSYNNAITLGHEVEDQGTVLPEDLDEECRISEGRINQFREKKRFQRESSPIPEF